MMQVPEGSVDLCHAGQVCELFDQAAEANLATAGRTGCVVDLPKRGQLVISGDLHDHRDNFRRVLKVADLAASPDHHVIFQEVIHGPNLINNLDLSYRILARAAETKRAFPAQFHMILANHDLSQVNNVGILKHGMNVVEAFAGGLVYLFADKADSVAASIDRFIRTLPLAVRCANGVFASHSLPAPRYRDRFDPGILARQLEHADTVGPIGGAYLMVWGRNLDPAYAQELGAAWGVEYFVLGHQKADGGVDDVAENILIVNSDSARGAAVRIDLSARYDMDRLYNAAVQLAGVRA